MKFLAAWFNHKLYMERIVNAVKTSCQIKKLQCSLILLLEKLADKISAKLLASSLDYLALHTQLVSFELPLEKLWASKVILTVSARIESLAVRLAICDFEHLQ